MLGITGQMNAPQKHPSSVLKRLNHEIVVQDKVLLGRKGRSPAPTKLYQRRKKISFCQDIECICLDLLTLTDQHLASLEKISSNLRPAGCRPSCRCRRSRRFCPSCRCLSTEKSLKWHNTRLLFLLCFFPQIRQISDVVPLGWNDKSDGTQASRVAKNIFPPWQRDFSRTTFDTSAFQLLFCTYRLTG